MKTALDIMRAVKALGGRLEPAGDRLRTLLPADCSLEIKNAIRQHKSELLDLLRARSAGLTPDCAPWLHIARQVLAGEFDGADRSLAESLYIGLRAIKHSDCQRASARLRRLIPEEKTEGESKPEQTKI